MMLLALLAALAAAGYYYARNRADEEIRGFVEARLAEQFAPRGLAISLGHARLVEGRGIELRDIAVLDPSADAPHTELVRIDQVFIYARITLPDLLSRPPDADHVSVQNLRLRAARQLDGSWNVARLFPLPDCGGKSPTVTIDGAVVEIQDSPGGRATSLDLREINLTVSPLEADAAAPQSARLRIEGHLTGDHFRRLTLQGVIDAENGVWSAGGDVEDLKLSPELYDKLPRELDAYVAQLKSLEGHATLRFDAAQSARDAPISFAVRGNLHQARFNHERLPYPLTELTAQVYADNRLLEIRDCQARCGAATISLTARKQGLSPQDPATLTLVATQLPLDPRLADTLPADLSDAWQKFSPEGPVDARLTLAFDGRNWTPDLVIDSRGASFAYYKFPYRIYECTGQVRLQNNVCTVEVIGKAAGRPVEFRGEFREPGDNFSGGVSVTLDGAIPIDEALLAALPDGAQRVIRSLHPRGLISFRGSFGRADARSPTIDSEFDIGLLDCAMRYDKFPYPIDHIRGLLHSRNGDWDFRDLEGRNDSGYIVCNGSWRSAAAGGALKLNLVGTEIPLEDELRDALTGGAQRVWAGLRPRGAVDHVNVELEYAPDGKGLTLDVTAQKWKPKSGAQAGGMTVDPVWFPYAMEIASGTLHFRDGVVELSEIAGAHGKTTFTLSGACRHADDGSWRVKLDHLAADRIACDHEFASALPAGLGDAVRRLRVTGPLNLQGSLELWGDGRPQRPLEAAWDLSLDLENGGLDAGLKLEHIHGGVRLHGGYGARGLQCQGTLAVDSLIYNQAQFTQIAGPLWIDQSRVLFGSWTNRASGVATPALQARVFGGALNADAELSLEGDKEFALHLELADGELARLSHEMTSRRDALSGKVQAAIELSGNGRGTHTWRGAGMVRLRSADIYELPVMLAMLKVLSLKRPDKTAFNSSDIDFQIEGDQLRFQRINFSGDTITLKGTGWMNLDRQIDIDFYTLVGRDRLRIPVITPALGLMSRELLLIHADGSLDDPQLSRKTFPGLNERLKQLFPELERQDPASSPGVTAWPGLMPGGGSSRR